MGHVVCEEEAISFRRSRYVIGSCDNARVPKCLNVGKGVASHHCLEQFDDRVGTKLFFLARVFARLRAVIDDINKQDIGVGLGGDDVHAVRVEFEPFVRVSEGEPLNLVGRGVVN